MDQSRKDGHFLVTFGHLLCYDLSVICRELILSISEWFSPKEETSR